MLLKIIGLAALITTANADNFQQYAEQLNEQVHCEPVRSGYVCTAYDEHGMKWIGYRFPVDHGVWKRNIWVRDDDS